MWLTGSNSQLSVEKSLRAEHGFSFVELMVTVVILAVGLVSIIQGFITATNAFNTTQNHSVAIQFLEAKMQEIEASAKIDNGIKKGNSQGEFSSGERNFAWSQEVISVEKSEDLDLSEDLNEVRLKVSWQERNLPRDLSLLTYLKNKKE